MKKITFKGILLDLDNTLYDYNLSHEAACLAVTNYVSGAYGLSTSSVSAAFDQARSETRENLYETAAAHNRMLYFQRMLEILSIKALGASLVLYDLYWDTFFENMVVFPEARAFLEYVHGRCKICLVTDLTAHIQHRKLHKLKLTELVDFIVTSEEVGQDKPNSMMFSQAIKKLNLEIKDVCMIGDNFQKDILGAAPLGIHSFWLTRELVQEQCSDLIVPFSSFKDLGEYFL